MRSKRTDPKEPMASQPPDAADGMAPDAVLASMDHQIHTSMNGVIGMLELLHGTELTADQREFIGMAQVSAENLLKLFDGMLDFSKVTAGKLPLEQLPFDLFGEVDKACAAHRAAAAARGLQLKVHSASDIQRFMIGDALRITQVMTTLIGNAVERAGSRQTGGQIRIDIESIAQQDGRCRLCVCVSDSGDNGDHAGAEFTGIFNGSRPIGPADPRHGPMQIGLALCKSLVELMEGQCGADHAPGAGGKFWFTLSLPLAASVLAGVRVLLIDDQPAVRRVAEQQLRQQAMRADSFGSAAAALTALAEAQAAQDPYRIAILNHLMAGVDGETLGAAIKADPACRGTLLVLLTPESSLARADRYSRAGFAASIAKPVGRQTLLDTLAILCAGLDSSKPLPFVADAMMLQPPAAPAAVPPLTGRRVLIVDDNHANNQVALRMLEKLGCRADIADGGQLALALHQAAPYDLILMDCRMPGMDGYQTSAAIRAAEAAAGIGRHTPIIAWTTSALPDERKKCAAAGMDDLIAKPVREPILQEIVARWLQPQAEDAPDGETDELESMRDLFGSSFVELAALYRNDVPKRFDALLTAAAAGDAGQMAKVAHSLSGSCASIGATRLAALCQALEARCKAGFIQDFESRLDAIRAEYERIETKLQSLVQSIEV